MKVLKVDVEIPFWCSFSEYGTVNIRPTYPFPPPPTIFGLIQNALQKPSIHILPNHQKKGIISQYLTDYSKLDFAIVIQESGEKIDDYLNILKGSRESETFTGNLNSKLNDKKRELDYDEKLKTFFKEYEISKKDQSQIKKKLAKIKRMTFYENLKRHDSGENLSERDKNEIEEILSILDKLDADVLINDIYKFWKSCKNGFTGYKLNKKWIRTQINRQKLINPKYTIYIRSYDDNGEYSLENILNYLKKPKRPLYLGESDDIININKAEIIEMSEEMSSKIDSVIPGVYTNSQLVKIPIKLKNDIPDEKGHNLICSIPHGELEQELSCLNASGENIVFL